MGEALTVVGEVAFVTAAFVLIMVVRRMTRESVESICIEIRGRSKQLGNGLAAGTNATT